MSMIMYSLYRNAASLINKWEISFISSFVYNCLSLLGFFLETISLTQINLHAYTAQTNIVLKLIILILKKKYVDLI